jgi:hypothetical protein
MVKLQDKSHVRLKNKINLTVGSLEYDSAMDKLNP